MTFPIDKSDQNKQAIIDDAGISLSYGELCTWSSEFSNYLEERSLIFILSKNCTAALAAYISCLNSKVIPLIIGANTDQSQLQSLINTYQPKYIWCEDDKEILKGESYALLHSSLGFNLYDRGIKAIEVFSELALLLSTSGSTGSPKLVRHSYQNVLGSAKNVAQLFELDGSERALAFLPLQYTMGLSVASSHIYAGATVLLAESALTSSQFWAFTKEQKASSMTGVPYSYAIMEKLRFFRMPLPDLKLITQGGGKLSEDFFKKLAEHAVNTNRKFIATYGQTEGTARMAYLPAEMALNKIGSIGIAVPNGRLSLIDDTDAEIVDNDAVGQLCYEGANVTLGYAQSSQDLIKGDENKGFLKTGDLAYRDADGYYYIRGRLKRFLKIFGLRIGLDDIETMVREQFGIECVSGGNDELLIVKIDQEELLEEVKQFLVSKTNLFHKAIAIEFTQEFRRTESGKAIF